MEKGQVLVKNVLVISDDKHIKLYFLPPMRQIIIEALYSNAKIRHDYIQLNPK